MSTIRQCRDDERPAILEIVNAAAEAYRGAIPADCWHDPYMPADELENEIASGVAFWGYELDGVLSGVMGIQEVADVELIRHAYVRPRSQRRTAALRCSGGTGRSRSVRSRRRWCSPTRRWTPRGGPAGSDRQCLANATLAVSIFGAFELW